MGQSCSPESAAAATDPPSTVQRIRQIRCFGITTVEALTFWSAVTLPLPTVVVLADGVGTPTELGVVTLLVVANLLAFYIGHGYGSR